MSECSLTYAAEVAARTARARPRTLDDRRSELVDVIVGLFQANQGVPSTREIAASAGVAEGTIFRAFATKEELVDAATAAVFCPEPLLRALDEIPPEGDLGDRLVLAVRVIQDHFRSVFDVMAAVGLTAPPAFHSPHPGCGGEEYAYQAWAALLDAVAGVMEPDAHRLRRSPVEVAVLLRALVFADCNPHLSRGGPHTPDSLVDVVLHGVLATARHDDLSTDCAPEGASSPPHRFAGPSADLFHPRS